MCVCVLCGNVMIDIVVHSSYTTLPAGDGNPVAWSTPHMHWSGLAHGSACIHVSASTPLALYSAVLGIYTSHPVPLLHPCGLFHIPTGNMKYKSALFGVHQEGERKCCRSCATQLCCVPVHISCQDGYFLPHLGEAVHGWTGGEVVR